MNFEGWSNLPDEERRKIASEWSPYRADGIQPLLDEIVAAFRKEYPEYEIPGHGNVHGNLMLVVKRPFIFDKREAPESFMGLDIRYSLREPVPKGFEVYTDYVWAPENYLAYVNSNAEDIRAALGDPTMNQEEILDALVGMRFDGWIRLCQEWGNTKMNPGERTLPEKAWWKFW